MVGQVFETVNHALPELTSQKKRETQEPRAITYPG
jgi:hypothetical protein